jgi:hypothetical protein
VDPFAESDYECNTRNGWISLELKRIVLNWAGEFAVAQGACRSRHRPMGQGLRTGAWDATHGVPAVATMALAPLEAREVGLLWRLRFLQHEFSCHA